MENLNKIAEEKYPYVFMCNKSIIDARRRGFVEGINYKQINFTRCLTTMSKSDACEVAKIIYDKKTIFVVTEEQAYKDWILFKLDGVKNKTFWIAFYESGDIELTFGDTYAGSNEMGLNTKAIYDAYEFLKQNSYEIK